jgi:ABC-type molybdate transport system substrate-binding protein
MLQLDVFVVVAGSNKNFFRRLNRTFTASSMATTAHFSLTASQALAKPSLSA